LETNPTFCSDVVANFFSQQPESVSVVKNEF
jgi:hypothetical protein